MKSALILLAVILAALALRSFDLNRLPNGLHWDEMDTGYQAYSLLRTGRDYFGRSLPFFTHSFADWRTPVFIYSAVPSVALFGLSSTSVRLPAVVWSVLSLLALYVLANRAFASLSQLRFGSWSLNIGHIATLLLAASPWHLQYSRQSVETISLLTTLLVALSCFFVALTRPRWLPISGLFFGLATAAYAPGKLFVPLLLSVLFFIFRRPLLKNLKFAAPAAIIFLGIFSPIFIDGLVGPSGMRFRELSIFTDPTTAAAIGYRREELALASGLPKVVGLSPRPIDRLVYNKLTFWGSAIVRNYFSSFSTEFLFLFGDKELRHSPNPVGYGMLLLPEALPLLLGLAVLFRKSHTPAFQLLISWLLLAPVSASLTRWDNPHAARLLILLPALVFTTSLGLKSLGHFSRPLFLLFLGLWFASAGFTYIYFFNNYRWESAAPFQYGFDQAISQAVSASGFDHVIVDFSPDSPLLAYLFYTRYPPDQFQLSQSQSPVEVLPGISAHQFGSVYLLLPGHYPWQDSQLHPPGRNLLIVTSRHPSITSLGPPASTISYPDSTPAFSSYSL